MADNPDDTPPNPGNTPDPADKIRDIYAGVVEVRKPNFGQILSTPADKLAAARQEAQGLLNQVIRPNSDEVNARAVGRMRFPALQSTLGLFATGLGKNADMATALFLTPEILNDAVGLDQANGRFISAGQLLSRGGETGKVLSEAGALKLSLQALDEARATIADTSVPEEVRTDIATAFEEAFRYEAEYKQRQKQAQSASAENAQSYQDKIAQAQSDGELADAVDAFMSGQKPQGVQR